MKWKESNEPTIIGFGLTWDTVTIANAVQKALCENNFLDEEGKPMKPDALTMGYNEDFTKSAFILLGHKSKSALQITIENEEQCIKFMGGIMGMYLPKGQKLAQFKKEFVKSQLLEASKYFEELLKIIGISNEPLVMTDIEKKANKLIDEIKNDTSPKRDNEILNELIEMIDKINNPEIKETARRIILELKGLA